MCDINASMFQYSPSHCLFPTRTLSLSATLFMAKMFCGTFFSALYQSLFGVFAIFAQNKTKLKSHKLYIGCRRYLPRYHTNNFFSCSLQSTQKKRATHERTREKNMYVSTKCSSLFIDICCCGVCTV